MSEYPSMDIAIEQLKKSHPLLADGIDNILRSELSDQYLRQGDDVMRIFTAKSKGTPEALEKAVNSYGQVCLDFLKLQGRFYKTGKYHQRDVATVISDVYENEEVMKKYYLDGLLLTFALWPNHQTLLRFFKERFLIKVEQSKHLIEVGVGHGLFFLAAAEALKSAKLTGIDISPFSLVYTDIIMNACGQTSDRYTLIKRDVIADNIEDLELADAIVCGEVMEHVVDPVTLLRQLKKACKPGGYVFLTTCANTEAVDHVYLFNDADHIRSTLELAGIVLIDEIVLAVPGMERDKRMPLNYACVARMPDDD